MWLREGDSRCGYKESWTMGGEDSDGWFSANDWLIIQNILQSEGIRRWIGYGGGKGGGKRSPNISSTDTQSDKLYNSCRQDGGLLVLSAPQNTHEMVMMHSHVLTLLHNLAFSSLYPGVCIYVRCFRSGAYTTDHVILRQWNWLWTVIWLQTGYFI